MNHDNHWDGVLDPETKAFDCGVETLTDSELIGLILRTGTKERSAVQLSQEVLRHNGRQLDNLIDLSLAELMAFEGIGRAKAVQLKAIGELCMRLSQRRITRRGRIFVAPDEIADYYTPRMRYEKQEILTVIMLDAKGRFIEDRAVTKGTLQYTVFSPREVYLYAIRAMARCIILLHNHPSGDPSPSKDDEDSTEQMMLAGELLGIPLLDHIIVGDGKYYSFMEHGKIKKK